MLLPCSQKKKCVPLSGGTHFLCFFREIREIRGIREIREIKEFSADAKQLIKLPKFPKLLKFLNLPIFAAWLIVFCCPKNKVSLKTNAQNDA